jgi:hypothetical protein
MIYYSQSYAGKPFLESEYHKKYMKKFEPNIKFENFDYKKVLLRKFNIPEMNIKKFPYNKIKFDDNDDNVKGFKLNDPPNKEINDLHDIIEGNHKDYVKDTDILLIDGKIQKPYDKFVSRLQIQNGIDNHLTTTLDNIEDGVDTRENFMKGYLVRLKEQKRERERKYDEWRDKDLTKIEGETVKTEQFF